MASSSRVDTPPDTSFVLEAGATPFPGYRLIRLRGRGGYAEVWEASSPDRKRVALKFMSTQQSSATARELRALQSLHSLDHPHLLKCTNVWCIPGYIVIGMELADASLFDLYLLYAEDLREPMSAGMILRHLYQAAHALDFLNSRRHLFDGRTVGFQHGDIKPNNILIIGETAKLADYGLATPTNGPTTPCHRHGTYDYMAPEVFRGSLSESSDQFSLAITYTVLRAGFFPFPPVPKKLTGTFIREAPNLTALAPAEQSIVARALAPVPQNRFPTCVDFVRALAHVCHVTSLPDIPHCMPSGVAASKLGTQLLTGSKSMEIAPQTGLSRIVPPRS